MKLLEIITEQSIVARLEGRDREAVINELVEALVRAGRLGAEHKGAVVKGVLDRERRSTTGFGEGIAVPHAKHAGLPGVCAAIGLSAGGIDFASIDLQPVHSVVLLLSPPDAPGEHKHADEHLHAMEVIFKMLSQDSSRRLLRQAASTHDVLRLLEEVDTQHV
jgi:PTS system nitrogen regulatory IIA component